jgi:NADP-dependent 3-hydroxy acid dehydrogenase YdfG
MKNPGVVIVTGGAGALAASIIQTYAAAGAKLVLAGLHEKPLRERAEPLGGLAVAVDLTRADGAEKMAAEAIGRFGRIDALIHTAGGFGMAPAEAGDAALLEQMLDLNLRTLSHAVGAVLPQMLRQGDGFIAGISAGIIRSGGGAGMTAYAAAKGAVSSYLKALEAEVRERGVRVAIVYPGGAIDTPQNRAAMPGANPEHWVDPAEIAQALLFAGSRSVRGRMVELAIGSRG